MMPTDFAATAKSETPFAARFCRQCGSELEGQSLRKIVKALPKLPPPPPNRIIRDGTGETKESKERTAAWSKSLETGSWK